MTVVSKGIVTETGYGGIEMDRKLAVVFGFKNNTEKALAGVKGTLNIHDLFDDELCGFAISYDTTIPPGGTATWTGGRSVRFGLNAANDQKFADLKDDKYKAVWIPDMVVFEDGTKMVGPDE